MNKSTWTSVVKRDFCLQFIRFPRMKKSWTELRDVTGTAPRARARTFDQRDAVGHFTTAAVTTAAPMMAAIRLGHGSSRTMRQGAVLDSATSITAASAESARAAR